MLAAFGMVSVQTASADLLAYWNFNNNTIGGDLGTFNTTGSSEVYDSSNLTLNVASSGVYASTATIDFSSLNGTMGGTSNNNWGTYAGATNNAYSGAVAGGALAVSGASNNGSSVTFTLSTSGYENLILSYATRGTSTGFTTQTWAYSINGTDFTDFTSISGRNVTTWSVQQVDFSDIAALDNQSEIYLRVTFTGAGAGSTNGNNRLDNVQFNATEGAFVPEPASVGILALTGAGLLLRRRKA